MLGGYQNSLNPSYPSTGFTLISYQQNSGGNAQTSSANVLASYPQTSIGNVSTYPQSSSGNTQSSFPQTSSGNTLTSYPLSSSGNALNTSAYSSQPQAPIGIALNNTSFPNSYYDSTPPQNFWQPNAKPKTQFLNDTSFLDNQYSYANTLGRQSDNSSKNFRQMNINAPSYVPANFTPRNQLSEDKITTIQSVSTPPQTKEEDHEKLKVEMILKNQIIKNLTDQLSLVSKSRAKQLVDSSSLPSSTSSDSTSLNQSTKIPSNHYQLFQDLSRTLQEKTEELDATKERLEALLVSISINSGYTNVGRFDEQELTHKIVSRLSLLKNENENLLKMISFSVKSSLLVELGLLRNENASK